MVYCVHCTALCKQGGVARNLCSAVCVCVVSPRTSSWREGNKSKSCQICVLDKGGSALFEIAPAKGSPKETRRQNSLVNKSVIGLENHAPPPLGALSETQNTSRVPRLFPPKAGANAFIPVSPCLPSTFHSFQSKWDFSSTHTSFAWWETLPPCRVWNAAPIFTSTPCDDGIEDCYTVWTDNVSGGKNLMWAVLRGDTPK